MDKITREAWLQEAFRVAFEQAVKAEKKDEVPVGACLVWKGEIIAASHNQIRSRKDPTAHAEILSIKDASEKLKNERLTGSILVSTLEPCTMCTGALILARVSEVHFLTFENRLPALREVSQLKGHNHSVFWQAHDLEQFPSARLLKDFFQKKRNLKK